MKTKKQRLTIYRKALILVEGDREIKGVNPYSGLCIVLRMIAEGLTHFLQNLPNGENWDHKDTPKLFPEFGEYFRSYNNLKFKELYEENQRAWRIKVLNLCIKDTTTIYHS